MSNAKEILVTISKVTTKDEGAKVERHNAAIEKPVTASEINTAAAGQRAINAKLCMNLLAGKLSAEVSNAAAETGGLNKLLPDASQADKQAIRVCAAVTPAAIRKAWQKHVDSRKRVHGVTLQALANGVKEKPAEKAVPFKEQYRAAFAELFKTNRELAMSGELKALHDLAVDAGFENPDEENMTV